VTAPNAELAYRALDHIDANPDQHDQRVWISKDSCGTVACLAGWVCLLAGDKPAYEPYGEDPETELVTVLSVGTPAYDMGVPRRAADLLGIPYDSTSLFGHRLFSADNTREDLGRIVAEIFGPRPDEPVTVVDHDPATARRLAWESYGMGHALPDDDVPPNAGSAS